MSGPARPSEGSARVPAGATRDGQGAPGGAPAPALHAWLRGVGLLGPGLAGWHAAQPLLAGRSAWQHEPTLLGAPARLPAAERRRAGDIVRLSLAVADEACAAAGVEAAALVTVFAASTGDANNCHALCEALASPERVVSPTRFTNSVHNAPAGYWHIATQSQAASTSLCAFDASVGAGLVEAMAQCAAGAPAVLLVAADVAYPQPLRGVRPITDAFGVALVLAAQPGPGDLARLTLRFVDTPAQPCDGADLEALRRAVPAGRMLPLLQALAVGRRGPLVLDYLDGLGLEVTVADPEAPA